MDQLADQKLSPQRPPSLMRSLLAKTGLKKPEEPAAKQHFSRPNEHFWSVDFPIDYAHRSEISRLDVETDESYAGRYIAARLIRTTTHFSYLQQANTWA